MDHEVGMVYCFCMKSKGEGFRMVFCTFCTVRFGFGSVAACRGALA